LDVRGWETESFRSVACVRWKPTSTNVYRVGHKGKVLHSFNSYLLSIMLHCVYTKYSLSVMGLYRTELFTLCLALSTKGPVEPLFVWPSTFQLICLALKSYLAFAKVKYMPG